MVSADAAALARSSSTERTEKRSTNFHALCCQAWLLSAEDAWARGDVTRALRFAGEARARGEARGLLRSVLRADLITAACARTTGGQPSRRSLEEIARRAEEAELRAEAEIARAGLRAPSGSAATTSTRLLSRFGFDAAPTHTLVSRDARLALTARQRARVVSSFEGLLVDEESRTVHLRGNTIDLGRGPRTFQVFASLVEAGGDGVSAEELGARAMALDAYHPLRHRSRVSMAIARVRALLGRADAVRTVADRYVLARADAALLRRDRASPSTDG